MPLLRNLYRICNVAAMISTPTPGDTWKILPAVQVNDADLKFHAWILLEINGGNSSPEATVHIETSFDGTHWTSAAEPVVGNATNQNQCTLVEIPTLGPMVRARVAVAGGTPPTYTCQVQLCCNHPLRLMK